jgi:hypothetical protein
MTQEENPLKLKGPLTPYWQAFQDALDKAVGRWEKRPTPPTPPESLPAPPDQSK